MANSIVTSHLNTWIQTQDYWDCISEAVDMVLKPHWQFFQQNVFLFDVLLEHKRFPLPPI